MSKKVKIFVIVVGIIAIVILAFSYFGNNAPSAPTGLSSSTGINTIPGGGGSVTSSENVSDFSSLLSSINGISLDTSIFSSPAYEALRDNPVVLGTAVIGRQNPFAPIGSDAANPQQSGALQIQTLTVGKVVSTSAEFGALISNASTSPVSVVFNYGTTDALGSVTTPITVTKNGTALFTATKLTPSTTYYVEAVAVQGSVTTTGNITSFTTAATAQKR